MEEMLSSCKTSELVTARLYQGNGGATTSYWYSVTLEGDALGREKQVLFSYALPRLQRVECIEDAVFVRGESFFSKLEVTQFETLREQPTQFWSGKQVARGAQPSRLFAIAAAATVAAVGVAVVLLAPVMSRRRARNAA
jgi:hypothetical protein